MRKLLALGILLAAGAAAAGDLERYVRIDDSGPTKFYWASCTANPKSVMGTIPAGTRVRVVDETECRRLVDLGPDGKRRSVRLGYALTYFKVEWAGGTVWIASGTARESS